MRRSNRVSVLGCGCACPDSYLAVDFVVRPDIARPYTLHISEESFTTIWQCIACTYEIAEG
jgi:hypothetical protein